MSNECPFCNLQTETSRIIRTNDLTTTLLSNPRLMPGHTLVVPNRHVTHPDDLTDNELLAIFNEIKKVRAKLLKTIATGCDVRQNYRPFQKQGWIKVDHLHFHVLPRNQEDDLYQRSQKFESEIFMDLPDDERQQMTDSLKS